MVMQIITFYFDYLWREVFAANQSSLLFVGGAMTFLLSQLAGVGRFAHAQQWLGNLVTILVPAVSCSCALFRHRRHFRHCGTPAAFLQKSDLLCCQ